MKAEDLGLPLKAFWTFTFAPEAREGIADGSIRMSAEMKRILNVIRQKLRRKGVSGEVVFIWVAENPIEENPHVHLLTNLLVRRSEFELFAGWIEERWGHGTVHIERIRRPRAAGHYILKAVGYTAKGHGDPQGEIHGRRYGISRRIRPVEQRVVYEVPLEQVYALARLQAMAVQRGPGEQYIRIGDGVAVTPYGLTLGPRHNEQELLNVVSQLPELADPHGCGNGPDRPDGR